jgi:hypothetical protein
LENQLQNVFYWILVWFFSKIKQVRLVQSSSTIFTNLSHKSINASRNIATLLFARSQTYLYSKKLANLGLTLSESADGSIDAIYFI